MPKASTSCHKLPKVAIANTEYSTDSYLIVNDNKAIEKITFNLA